MMKLGRRDYEIQWQSVRFEVIDGDDRFVCGISLHELDPDRGGQIDGDEGLKLFEQRSAEILDAASSAIGKARADGIRHVACEKNKPIFVQLAK